MPKQIIIAEQHRLSAVFWEDQIQELIVATGTHQVSDIYLGVVENVLPGIDAAFVNIGDPDRNGFIHVTDLGPLRLKRRAGAITELLTPQQKVLVQVMKEPTGNKGPRLTGNITLPGRYLVLMPYGRGVNLSRRIKSENERNRLRALAILIKPPGMGLLVRTEAEGRAEEAIIEDLDTLQKQWEAIQQEASSTRAPSLLSRDDDFIQRVLRDMYTSDVNRIVVDSHTGVKRVKQHLLSWSGGKPPEGVLIDHHRDRISILDYFRVNAAIREALKPRVDLPSGGYIIIQPTEALTVIDVNSGSFTRSATARETVLWTNCEAATEIARQLRLRNIAGVIVVDFIDMDTRRDQLQVLEHFNKALKADKARPQIAQLSELGLVELTRKRQGQNIYELFGKICTACGGLGHTISLPDEWEPPARESIEPPASLDVKASQTQNLSDSFDIPSDNDTDDLDLMYHPNYQERGGVNTRRRRRRQLNEPLGKEEPVAKIGTRMNPILQSNSDLGEDIDSPSVNSLSLSPRTIIPRNNIISDDGMAGRSPILESGERFPKSQIIKSPREIEPPKVVCVEMTTEEQDVYAMMGISPLVRLDEEIRNPKSVILSVVLPGEGQSTNLSTKTPKDSEDSEDFEDSEDSEDFEDSGDSGDSEDSEEYSGVSTMSNQFFSSLNRDIEESVSMESDRSEPPIEQREATIQSESEQSPPLIRRRRRRSSALDGDDLTIG